MKRTDLNHVAALIETMRKLRSEQGCEWDRTQTPHSLMPYILEEAYELVDAIDSGELEEIRSELGDLLLQIVFQAQIFSERNHFGLNEVAAAINDKLIHRHPHIFSRQESGTHPSWEEIKRQELLDRGKAPELGARLPANLPALKQALKVCRHLGSKPNLDDQGDSGTELTEEEIGERLYELVCRAEASEVDADLALRKHLRRLLGPAQQAAEKADSGCPLLHPK